MLNRTINSGPTYMLFFKSLVLVCLFFSNFSFSKVIVPACEYLFNANSNEDIKGSLRHAQEEASQLASLFDQYLPKFISPGIK